MSYLVAFAVFVAVLAVLTTLFLRRVKKWIPKDLDRFFQSVDRLSSRKLFKVRFLHKDMYFVNDPELIQKVLTSETCFEKPQMIYKFFGISDGFLCCKYDQWRRDRKNFSSSFNNVMVNGFLPIFCEIADRMVAKVRARDRRQREFNIIYFTERCTISMILASSFNVYPKDIDDDEEVIENKIDKVAEAVKITSVLLSERFRKLQLFFDVFFRRTTQYRQLKDLKDYLYESLLEVLDKKSKQAKTSEAETQPSSFVQNIFINRLQIFKDEMTLSQVKDSIFTVVGAGFETTGTASAHCILFLAMNPDIQEKAYQEIVTVFPSKDTEITPDMLTKLEYMECIMKESLRLGPTVHAIAREAMADFEITPGNVTKKGSIFCINIYGLHRRKSLWGEDAEKFNPDRFLPENFEGKQQFFMPFSVGRRNCIGYRYAYMSFKIMLIKLLRNFKFTTNLRLEEIKFNRQIALKLMGKHSVMIEERTDE